MVLGLLVLGIAGLTVLSIWAKTTHDIRYYARFKYHINYHKEYTESLRGNANSIKELASLFFYGECAYEHGENMINILDEVGDSTFSIAIDNLTDVEKFNLYLYFQAGIDAISSKQKIEGFDTERILSKEKFEQEHPLVISKLNINH